jgi:hypothetical protein
MIPAPNLIAGIPIGITNNGWLAVLGTAVIWPLERAWMTATVASFSERGRHLIGGSPAYAIEFATALTTALPVALLAHAVKRFIT